MPGPSVVTLVSAIALPTVPVKTVAPLAFTVSALVPLSVFAKLTHEANYVGQWERLGFAESKLTGVGLAQLTGIVLYVNPSTSVLGAIYMTGYLGGAISHWVRLGEPTPMMVPLSTCLLLWGGLFLREERLQALLPLRKKNGASM